MYASELIEKLTTLIKTHGDYLVMNEYGQVIDAPEFNDDTIPCFGVGFDEYDPE